MNLTVPKSGAKNCEKTKVITDVGILAFSSGQIYINRNMHKWQKTQLSLELAGLRQH